MTKHSAVHSHWFGGIPLADYAGSALYGRKSKIIIGTAGTNGLEVTDLKCVFKVEKSMSAKPNNSTIKIYNLAPPSWNTILQEGSRVIIEAGYDGPQYGLIYDGDVVQTLRYSDDATTHITEIITQDGDVFLNSSFISVSYGPGETSESLISSMAGQGGVELGPISPNLTKTKLARSKAMFGQPKDYARNIAKSEGALFYINDRKITLVKPTDPPDGEVINLSPASGLIGMPEQTDDGIKAKCLLNPLLNINKLVFIDNSLVKQKTGTKKELGDGIYKVLTLSHTGDTWGNDWYTEFTGVAQPGMVPLTGNSFNK